MRRVEALRTVEAIRAAFPATDWPPDRVEVWVTSLSDFTRVEAKRALARVIATREATSAPPIGVFRRLVVEDRLGLPSAEEAWLMASHRSTVAPPLVYCLTCAGTGYECIADETICPLCRGHGRLPDPSWVSAVPDVVRRAVGFVGGSSAIRASQRPEKLREEFVRAYERLRSEAIERENLRTLGVENLDAVGSKAIEA